MTTRAPRQGVLALAALAAPQAFGQAASVSPTEIRIATLQDLSGLLAGPGKQTLNGMRMRVDEINAQGGIAGRKLTLLVEDHAYDPQRTVLAT
jgi:branched-chain amino acid transport system substrate-binding protein